MSKIATILLAEDEESWSEPIKDYLEDIGFEVIKVEDLEELIDKAYKADLLIIDVLMPEKKENGPWVLHGGIEAAAKLINQEKISSVVPIVFISAVVSDIPFLLEKYAISKRRCVCLDKPFTPDALGEIVKRELKRCGTI